MDFLSPFLFSYDSIFDILFILMYNYYELRYITMKKYIVILIAIILLSLFGCSKEEEPVTNNQGNSDITFEEDKQLLLSIENLDHLYFTGDYAEPVIICSNKDISDCEISWSSTKEEVAKFIDGKLWFLSPGKTMIVCKVDENEVIKIVSVEEDRMVGESEPEMIEREKRAEERRKEREQEAHDNGFETYREYKEYLWNVQRQAEYEEEVKNAEELGLTYEDYFCLMHFGATYEVMKEKLASCGLSCYHELNTWTIHEVIDEEKLQKLLIITNYIRRELDLDHSNLYLEVTAYNNHGKPVDEKMWKEIEDILPMDEEEFNRTNYIFSYFNDLFIVIKYLNRNDENYEFKLTEEELQAIEECLKDYEGK